MPGGYIGGWYGDTGLDIAGNHLPVYAVAAGILDY
jgi:murein DD-endopeptidase MepM/ murein hydrolase activator NlpD